MFRHPRWRAAMLGLSVFLMLRPALSAHVTKGTGKVTLTIGWGEEPAFSGYRNSVDVVVNDAAGKPVTDPGATLAVEISFGSERVTLPLQPSGERPGLFRAWLVPTRPGTYTFHITGKVKDQAIDLTSTCSDTTFHCIADASDVQFPAKDPSVGQLAERVNREVPRAERAAETAASARTLGMAALGIAMLALAGTIGVGLRKGTKGA